MIGKDLIAASSTPLVLSILARGESYGYDIIHQIRELSDGEIVWADGMIYPLLNRMEKKGLITSQWRLSENGRRRKYYSINTTGTAALEAEKEQWKIVTGTLNRSWSVSYG